MEGITGRIPWKDTFLGFGVISFFALTPGINVFTPVAVLFFLVKLGWGYGLLAQAMALTVFLFLSPVAFGSVQNLFVESFLLGPILFQFLRRGFTVTKTAAYATVLVIGLLLLILILWAAQTGNHPYHAVSSAIDQSVDASLELYREMNVPEAATDAARETLQDMKNVLSRYWAGFVAACVLLLVWMNAWIGDHVLRRWGLRSFQFCELSRWSLPETLVWLVIAAGGCGLTPYSALQTAGINLSIFLSLAYLFQGLAIVNFYVNKYGFSRIMRVLVYSLILIQTYMLLIVALAGLFDVWFDFRRLKRADGGQNML